MEFAFITSMNRSTGKIPFRIVYSKVPNHVLNLVILPKLQGSNAQANDLLGKSSQIHHEVRTKLDASNAKYKADVDKHRRLKTFNEGELVMIYRCKQRFQIGT